MAGNWKTRTRKAQKKNLKGRIAIYGPSGGGKTFTALRLATGMQAAQTHEGRILFVDTEFRSSELYSDTFDFDIVEMNPGSDFPPTIENVAQVLAEAPAEGYSQIIVDSISHTWKELLTEIDRLAASQFKNNSHRAWAVGTPKQEAFIRALKVCDADIIVCMRSATEWDIQKNSKGKTEVVRVGTKPVQGKGLEYEFDMLLAVNTDHWVTVEKDRTGKFQDQSYEKPGEQWGRDIWAWLNSGRADVIDGQWDAEKDKLEKAFGDLGITLADADAWHRKTLGKGLAYTDRQGRMAAFRKLRENPELAKDFIQRNPKGEE